MKIGCRRLPHDGGPTFFWEPRGKVYFITICCIPRETQLAHPALWDGHAAERIVEVLLGR